MCITYISMYSHSGFSLHCGSAPPPPHRNPLQAARRDGGQRPSEGGKWGQH